jgi:hypothetical protein
MENQILEQHERHPAQKKRGLYAAAARMHGVAYGAASRPLVQFTLLRKPDRAQTPDRTATDEKEVRIFRRLRAGILHGQLADLAVLSQDIFLADPLAIGKTRVTMTMVGGKIVFRAQ